LKSTIPNRKRVIRGHKVKILRKVLQNKINLTNKRKLMKKNSFIESSVLKKRSR